MTYTTPKTLTEVRELQLATTELLRVHEAGLDRRRLTAQGKAPASVEGMTAAEIRSQAGGPSETTMATYRRRANRLLKDAAEHGVDVWSLALDRAGTKGSWYASRAALLNVVIADMRVAKRRIDQVLRTAAGRPLVGDEQRYVVETARELARLSNVLVKTPEGLPMNGLGQPLGRRATSKSRSLRGLPQQWREVVGGELPPNVRMAWLVQCVTGCRNAELAKGVELELMRNGRLYTRVYGAKLKAHTGQPTRETLLDVTAGPTAMLAKLLVPGKRQTVRLDRSVEAYRKMVSRYAEPLTPRRGAATAVSTYSSRHQYKADLEAAGLSRDELARAMGHQATETAHYYGGAGGAGTSAVKPVAVRASKAVRSRNRHLAVSSRSVSAPAAATTAPAAPAAPAAVRGTVPAVSPATAPSVDPAPGLITVTPTPAPSKTKRPRP